MINLNWAAVYSKSCEVQFDWRLLSLLAFVLAGCHSEQPAGPLSTSRLALPTDADSIVRFCADCHELPKATSFAKSRWSEEVEQGIRIYTQSGRDDLVIPDLDASIAYFRDAAPDELVIFPPTRVADTRFVARSVSWPNDRKPVSISSMLMIHPPHERPKFFLTDMWTGMCSLVTSTADGIAVEELGAVAHPAHIEPLGVAQNGALDYVVADLGTLSPQAEKQGSVWVLRRGLGQSTQQPLKLGLSRVADVRPIDYDDDGDTDLLVGDFGLHFVGSIMLGTNEQATGINEQPTGINEQPRINSPRYRWDVIDPRPGAISLPTIDFDGDGRMDFVALIAQQFETVELKLNRGNGRFESKVIFAAGDPSFGTSSMELVDFDQDGDIDVLYTNGDTFDDALAKPYHGIKWLENEGAFPFTIHHVGDMPGCYKAVAGDIDLDGDMDIAAVSYLPNEEVSKFALDTFDGVAWFEHQNDGSFLRHALSRNSCQAATCALADWDLDGDLDLIVPPSSVHHEPSDGLTVFINQSPNVDSGNK